MKAYKCSTDVQPSSPLKALKFKVESPEQSERLQKVLFELGYKWAYETVQTPKNLEADHIFAEDHGALYWSISDGLFDQYDNKEKDTEKFIRRHSGGQAERGIKKHSKKAVKKDKWISIPCGGVEDGEIPDNTLFLVYCNYDHKMHVARYHQDATTWASDKGGWLDNNDSDCYLSNVTHYRKLPRGPKD